jgi:hypothetical protein
MDATSTIQILESIKYGYNDIYTTFYKIACLDDREQEVYKSGYKDGLNKGLDEAIKLLKEIKPNE